MARKSNARKKAKISAKRAIRLKEKTKREREKAIRDPSYKPKTKRRRR